MRASVEDALKNEVEKTISIERWMNEAVNLILPVINDPDVIAKVL